MRKHFLLLFLMSLLPFYGWAADGDITTEPKGFTGTAALTYDGTEQDLLDVLGAVSGTNFKIYFKAVKAGEAVPTWNATEWTKTSPKATNAGTYYVYFVAYDEVAQLTPTVGAFVSSVINKAALVEGADADYTKPAGATGLEYNGSAKTLISTLGHVVTVAEGGTGSAEKCGSFSYALGVKVNDEWTDEGCTYGEASPKATNAGTYRVYWKLSGSDNSAEVKAYIDVTITALALDAYDAAKYTYTTKTLTYNGAAQTDLPTIAVKKGAKTLAAGTDYDVVWYKKVGAGAPTYLDENKQVPTYAKYQGSDITYYARVEGKGNYSGYVSHHEDLDATKIWKVTVAQKSMMTYVQPLSKTYNGEKVAVTVTSGNTNITNAQVVTTGLLSADEDLKAQLWTMFSRGSESETAITDAMLAEWNATATAPVNYRKNGYPMVAHVVHPADPGTSFFVDDNYAITFMQVGVLSINQRELKVTAKKQQKQYTGEQVDIDHTIDIAGDDATVQIADADATTGIVGTEDVTALMQINLKDFATAEYIEKDVYPGAILVTATAAQANSNYFITGTAGDFEITGKALKLIAATSEKPYGYKLGADVLNWLTDVPSVTTLNGTPEYEVRDADDNLKNIGDLLERGIYTITITNGTELAPENYSIAAADVFSGTLTITKKALKATVVSQSVSLGAVVASGDDNTLLQGTDYVEFDGLVGDEVVKYEIYSGQSTAAPGTFDEVITVKLVDPLVTETTFYNDNYTLADADITKGNLTINAANTVVLKRDEANLVEFIKNNKWTAGDAQTIKFADDRKIDAETWNSFVLPFDIKVKDLSKAAGVDYCVVNVLNPTATKVVDGKAQVRFNLTMGEIKANTPFLMKTVTSKAKGTAITVTGKIVEAVETSVKNSDEDITFNALYAKKVMKANNEFPNNTADNAAWKKGNDSEDPDDQVRLSALASYIAVPAGTLARIFVEDFENGTTVIKELGVDGTNKAYALDGWYTLNGVKLQGAPTEKGIYINNGKKVVIK